MSWINEFSIVLLKTITGRFLSLQFCKLETWGQILSVSPLSWQDIRDGDTETGLICQRMDGGWNPINIWEVLKGLTFNPSIAMNWETSNHMPTGRGEGNDIKGYEKEMPHSH